MQLNKNVQGQKVKVTGDTTLFGQ